MGYVDQPEVAVNTEDEIRNVLAVLVLAGWVLTFMVAIVSETRSSGSIFFVPFLGSICLALMELL